MEYAVRLLSWVDKRVVSTVEKQAIQLLLLFSTYCINFSFKKLFWDSMSSQNRYSYN